MNEGEIYKEGKQERFPNYRGGSDVCVRYQGVEVRGAGSPEKETYTVRVIKF